MKTAGTSFRNMIEDTLSNKIYPTRKDLSANKNGWYANNQKLIEMLENGNERLKESTIVCGHYPYIVADKFFKDSRIAVFLRDPISRTISIIGHRITIDQGEHRTVSELLENDNFINNQVKNYQTKISAISDIYASVNQSFKINEDDFHTALCRLESIDFIGITEEFDKSVELFSKTFDITLNKVMKLNVGKQIDINDDQMQRIRELVSLDIQFYERAKEIFNNKYSSTPLVNEKLVEE